VASRTWHTVNSGFFPPVGQPELRQEQMTDARQDQVTHDRAILPHLEVVHAQLRLTVLEQPFDMPAAEGHQQLNLQGRCLGGVAQEELHFVGLQYVPRHDQMVRSRRQAVLVFDPERNPLRFPHHRPFAAVLDAEPLPGNLAQDRRMLQDLAHFGGRRVAHLQTRQLAASPRAPVPGVLPIENFRRPRPAHKVRRDLGHIVLSQAIHRPQKWGFSAVSFVEGQPREPHPVAQRPLHLAESDLPLGAVHDLVGDARFPATGPILMPRFFGEIQFSIEQRMEVAGHVAEVHTDHTVLQLAAAAAVLPLDAGRLFALLVEAGLVDDTDAVRVAMASSHPPLHLVAGCLIVPLEQAQELLQRTGWHARRVGDWFHALALQVAQLPRNVGLQVGPVRDPSHTAVKLVKIRSQHRSNTEDCVGVHAMGLLGSSSTRTSHRLAA